MQRSELFKVLSDACNNWKSKLTPRQITPINIIVLVFTESKVIHVYVKGEY